MIKSLSKIITKFIHLKYKNFWSISDLNIYDSYDAAAAVCNNNAYENNDLVQVVIKKNIAYQNYLSSPPIFDQRALSTLTAIGLAKTLDKLNVIDFGGGGGFHYTIASNSISKNFHLNWRVVETPAMVMAAKVMENSQLKFCTNLFEAIYDLNEVDLIFSSGALQYCPDPMQQLRELIKLNARYLYLTRTVFSEAPNNIYSVQTSDLSSNGPGPLPSGYSDTKIKYPITFSNKNDAELIILEKYNIKFMISDEKSVYKLDGKDLDTFSYFCVRKDI